MESESKLSIVEIFVDVRESRQAKRVEHKLTDILVVAICGVLAGANDFVEIPELLATLALDDFIVSIDGSRTHFIGVSMPSSATIRCAAVMAMPLKTSQSCVILHSI